MRSILAPILIFSLICAGTTSLALYLSDTAFHWLHAAMIGYFALLTLVLHTWQERALRTDPRGFVWRIMTGLVVKMLMSLILLGLLLVLIPRPQVIPLAVAFALLYLAYLAFSTVRLTGALRKAPRP